MKHSDNGTASLTRKSAESSTMTADPASIATQLRSLADQVASLATTPPVTPTPTGPVVDTKHFQLVVDEQFNGTSLDKKVWWDPYDGVAGTAGVGRRKGSLATVKNGQLVIAAERPSANNVDWNRWFSTGCAMGPVAQTYGRWEVEATASDGAGFWPNMQLWPTDEVWPLHIELDIFESPVGTRDKATWTTHYGSDNKQQSVSYAADFNRPNQWVIEWTPSRIQMWFNGVLTVDIADKALIPTTPHHFVAQTDMGSWAGAPTTRDPLRMELALNYVRQYKYVA